MSNITINTKKKFQKTDHCYEYSNKEIVYTGKLPDWPSMLALDWSRVRGPVIRRIN